MKYSKPKRAHADEQRLGKNMDIGQVQCSKLCHLCIQPSWAVLFRPLPEWDTNEQESFLEATEHLTVRDGNISAWYLCEHSADCCTALRRQSMPSPTSQCQALQVPAPASALALGDKLSGLWARTAGTWFYLCRTLPASRNLLSWGICLFYPHPTEFGLHVFRQGTQTQHHLKLPQRLEVETRSAEIENKPQLCTQHIYKINNSS